MAKKQKRSKPIIPTRLFVFLALIGIIGVYVILRTFAAVPNISIEGESGTISNGAIVVSDSSASGQSAVQFRGGTPPPPPVEGNFSGYMTRSGTGLAGVIIKVVNIYPPNWPDLETLGGLSCGSLSPPNCYLVESGATGAWGVNVDPGTQYMLKVYPPSLCDANADTPAQYVTSDSGYVNSGGSPFHSTAASPGYDVYNVYNNGRYLYDMPVHVFPAVEGALNGGATYTDLNIDFSTRSGTFQTSYGPQSC